jgi:hypothetical protein
MQTQNDRLTQPDRNHDAHANNNRDTDATSKRKQALSAPADTCNKQSAAKKPHQHHHTEQGCTITDAYLTGLLKASVIISLLLKPQVKL